MRGPEGELRLRSYARFHAEGELDETLFRRVLSGLSCRNYEAAPGALGLSPSSVSRRFIVASSAKLRRIQERDLSGLDVVALFVDGKTFAGDQMVLALGETVQGRKVPLGFMQTYMPRNRNSYEVSKPEVLRGFLLKTSP